MNRALLHVLTSFLKWNTCGGETNCTVKALGGSDRWRTVADLNVELVWRPGQWRLLQHVVLHDHLLISIYWGVCVIRVVP